MSEKLLSKKTKKENKTAQNKTVSRSRES